MSALSINQVNPADLNSQSTTNVASNNRWKRSVKEISILQKFTIPTPPQLEVRRITRLNKQKAIFLKKGNDKITLKSIVCSFMGIILSIICTRVINFWPQHHVIENQKYWYEFLLLLTLGWGPIAAANIANICLFSLGTQGINSLKVQGIVYLFG